VEASGAVFFQVEGGEVPVMLGLFEVVGNAKDGRGLVELDCKFGGGMDPPAELVRYAQRGRDYLVLLAAAGGGAGRVLLTWRGSEPLELTEPGIGFKDGRPLIEWIVVPGRYELRTTGDILDWQARFQTNVAGALLRYHDPDPITQAARFYQLLHLPAGP
jgi:hypothetical protein